MSKLYLCLFGWYTYFMFDISLELNVNNTKSYPKQNI